MRRTILVFLTAVLAVVALGATVVATQGERSTVTRPRLERSLSTTFANLYAQTARLQGRHGITPSSLHTQAMCDKAGAQNQDVGPGGDWNCLMSWTDPEVPMPPEGYGKFELNVHSNDCYTASGPSKLVGFLTMTDRRGATVTNPIFEFDSCFDPHSDNTPTGIEFPSLLALVTTIVAPDQQRAASLQFTCGSGQHGCVGTVEVSDGRTSLGTISIDLAEESTTTVRIPRPIPEGASEVVFTFHLTTGVGPTSPVTLPVQG